MDRNARKIRLVAPDISVALRKESVDRNSPACRKKIGRLLVALRKESVDRNDKISAIRITRERVALRKESVDRNFFAVSLNYKEVLSLSARRAWIEICIMGMI